MKGEVEREGALKNGKTKTYVVKVGRKGGREEEEEESNS